MRVIQTKNDTIRLIFNPKTDGLCLSDFLIVRDGKDNFLAQIVEIYDDKFNQEENVAVIKLVYRIYLIIRLYLMITLLHPVNAKLQKLNLKKLKNA